jgi:2-(1,2-epoxy-1,2-dihydrophenyl)acetyl-CoA isomerase
MCSMPYPDRPDGDELNTPVLHWREGGIGYLRFNRPRSLNAIDVPMAQAFASAIDRLAEDAALRVLVISAEGRAFQAGGDIAAMRADPVAVAPQLFGGMHAGLARLATMDAPVIASVHGAVAGGGFGLVLACDLVVAAEDTRFAIAYPAIGASADCGTTWALPRLVGLRQALQIALLAEPIDAATALRLGLVNEVVRAEQLAPRTQALADRLAAGPTRAYGRLKALLRSSSERSFMGQLEAEAQAFLACAGSADFAEGLSAFLEKRSPRFSGR